jgi:hypothetical protein
VRKFQARDQVEYNGLLIAKFRSSFIIDVNEFNNKFISHDLIPSQYCWGGIPVRARSQLR